MEFKDLGLSEPVLESLHKQGFSAPTSIQEKSVPPLMQGRDVIAKAQTGSGKTLAFGIPLLERVDANRVSIQAVVVCPTRELAQQVADDLTITGKEKGIKVALVVGGVHVRTQRMTIPGCQVVVGTPGRMVDLLEDRYLPVEWTEFFVLDEFDRLLDMGFLDDINKIVAKLPDERQTALYSATTPQAVMRHAHGLLQNPVEVEIHTDLETVATVRQRAVRTSSARKLAILERLLADDTEGEGSTIVFCNTKRQVRQLDRELWAKDFSVASLSGDHDQSVRFKVMERFRNREIQVLVATDVAARGLDIDHIGHVINYDVPFEAEDYVHRIGRTARAGRDGVVTTLVGSEDHQAFSRIFRELEGQIEMLTESLDPARRKKSAPRRGKDRDDDRKKREPARREDAAAPDTVRERALGDAEPAAGDDAGEGTRKKRRRRRKKSGERDEAPREKTGAREDSKPKSRGRSEKKPDGEGRQRRERRDDSRDKDRGGDKRKRGDSRRGDSGRDGGGRRREGRSRSRRDSEDRKPDEPSSMIAGERDDVDHLDGGPPRRSGGDPRRARNRYKRWEEEQLNKPVGLIADNWDQVEEIDHIRKDGGSAKGGDEKGDRKANGSRANADGGRKRRRGGRRSRGRGRSGSARESGASSGEGGGERKD